MWPHNNTLIKIRGHKILPVTKFITHDLYRIRSAFNRLLVVDVGLSTIEYEEAKSILKAKLGGHTWITWKECPKLNLEALMSLSA